MSRAVDASPKFNQTVKVKGLVLQTKNAPQGPKKIKIFVNRSSVGFEDVEDAEEPEAAQILELSEEQIVNGTVIPLRFVRFQSVSSLQVSTLSPLLSRHSLRSWVDCYRSS